MLAALTSDKAFSMNSYGELPGVHPFGNGDDHKMFSVAADTSTLSNASIALASTWIKTCLEQHSICASRQKDSQLPTRVINVSNPRRPFLEPGGLKKLNYVTLSYKWGSSMDYMTSKSNVKDHHKKIIFEKLPKTLQEAIEVTHRLGFSYLWIDALCIIQDDSNDQEREISQMGHIFSRSVLTLCAKDAADAAAGLAFQRDPRCIKPCRLDFRATVQSQIFNVITYVTCYGSVLGGAPLEKRGWALQEQVLSVRSLNFHARELRWRCLCGYAGEGKPKSPPVFSGLFNFEDWKTMYNNSDDFGLMRFWMEYRDPTPYNRDPEYEGVFACWNRFVELYSYRSLTYSKDVLSAIAGIATTLAERHGISYVNGLWKEDLHRSLLWEVNVGMRNSPRPDFLARASEAKVLQDYPSWTWVSQWGKSVRYKPFSWWITRYVVYKIYVTSQNSGLSMETTANRETSEQMATPVLFQQVTLKNLKIEGYTTKGIVDVGDSLLRIPRMERMREGIWTRYVLAPGTRDIIGYVSLDSDPKRSSIHEITCCLCEVQRSYKVGWMELICLGLESTGIPDEYRRIGIFYQEFDDMAHLPSNLDVWEYLPNLRRDWRSETITLV